MGCPLCSVVYAALPRAECPFCRGAGVVMLHPETTATYGPAVVARAVQLHVGAYPEYASTYDLALVAQQLIERALILPPEPFDGVVTEAVDRLNRQSVGTLAGRLLSARGLRPHRPPKPAPAASRAGASKPPAIPRRADGRPDLKLVGG